MNKKGIAMVSILFAIVYFMLGMIVYQLIKPDIVIQRDSDHLNCSSPDDSGDMMSCLVLDSIIPILIIIVLSTSGGIVTEKLLAK